MQRWQIAEPEIIHDLITLGFRRLGGVLNKIADESFAVPAMNLAQHIVEVVTRVNGDGSLGTRQLCDGVSRVGIVRIGKRILVRRVGAFQLRIHAFHTAKHAIERIVLKHENDDVLNGVGHGAIKSDAASRLRRRLICLLTGEIHD